MWYTCSVWEDIRMDKETLMMLANKLMFTMDDSEYDTLLDEFDTIIKQRWYRYGRTYGLSDSIK